MGGPDSLEAVEPFLFNLFRDHELIPLPLGFLWQWRFARLVSRARAKIVRDYYTQIGGQARRSARSRARRRTRWRRGSTRARRRALLAATWRCATRRRSRARRSRAVAADGSRTRRGALALSALHDRHHRLVAVGAAPRARGQVARRRRRRAARDRSLARRSRATSTRSPQQVRRGLEQFPEAERARRRAPVLGARAAR